MNDFYYSSVAVAGTLGATVTSGNTSIYLSSTPAGYPTTFPFVLCIDYNTASMELVKVTSGAGTAGNPWTVTRGFDGTTATSHTGGSAVVSHDACANDYTLGSAHRAATSSVHGLPSSAWQTANIALISEQVLANSSTSTVTFSAIPQTYRHLLVSVCGRGTYGGAQHVDIVATVNGDTGAHYSAVEMKISTETGSLVGPSASTQYAQNAWGWFLKIAAAGGGSGVNAGIGQATIPYYAGTTFNKGFVSHSGFGNGTGSALEVGSRWGWWNHTAQAGITTLALAVASGYYVTGTSVSLHGIG